MAKKRQFDEDAEPANQSLTGTLGQQTQDKRQRMGAGDPGGTIALDPYSRMTQGAQGGADPSRYNQMLGLQQRPPMPQGQMGGPGMGMPHMGQPAPGGPQPMGQAQGQNPFLQALAQWHARQQQPQGQPGQGQPQWGPPVNMQPGQVPPGAQGQPPQQQPQWGGPVAPYRPMNRVANIRGDGTQ